MESQNTILLACATKGGEGEKVREKRISWLQLMFTYHWKPWQAEQIVATKWHHAWPGKTF